MTDTGGMKGDEIGRSVKEISGVVGFGDDVVF